MNKQEFNIVSGLADLLETYTDKVSKLKNNKTMPFSTMDMAGWKLYFQQLILTDVLEDGRGWGSETNDTNVGVGKDGEFSAGELYQLLMQCYKYLYLALTVTEIHLTEEGWHLDGNEEFQDVCKCHSNVAGGRHVRMDGVFPQADPDGHPCGRQGFRRANE